MKEKISGSVRCESTLCRSRLDQSIMLLVSVSIIVYAIFEQQVSGLPLYTEFRLWVGIILLVIVLISFLDTQLKKLMLGTMNKIPFIVIPTMLTNLYMKNIEPYYTMFFISVYLSMSFLISSKKGIRAYITIITLGVIGVLLAVTDSELHKVMVLISVLVVGTLIWIIGYEFVWNHNKLSNALNQAQKINYLHSHKLRAPVARIIGLNTLIDMGDKDALKLLRHEIKSIDQELINIQSVINQPQEEAKMPFRFTPKSLSPLEYTLIVAELIFLINVFFIH